jgi:hypothetical protein
VKALFGARGGAIRSVLDAVPRRVDALISEQVSGEHLVAAVTGEEHLHLRGRFARQAMHADRRGDRERLVEDLREARQ